MSQQEDGFFTVTFHEEADEEMTNLLRSIGMDVNAASEFILKMKVGKCIHCGEYPKDLSIAACDPEYITSDGELVGDTICGDCLEKGL